MKNLKVVAFGLVLIGNTLVFAQGKPKMSVEQKSEKITKRLTEQLDLSASQASQVSTMSADYFTEVRELKSNTSLSKEEQKKLIQAAQKRKVS